MPTILVIWLAKLSAKLSKLLGRGDGSALPGLVAERLQPNLLKSIGTQLGGRVVLVTGTNGKTTTTRMITAALETDEATVLTNRAGSNLTRGLLSTLIQASNWRGRISSKLAVFEVDEASFPEAFKALSPSTAVVLNLFRDQLDRYGELNTLAAKLKQALADTTSQVILNADDPLVAWLGQDLASARYFGLKSAEVKKLAHDYAADSNACPVCGSALVYDEIYYAHIGSYHCSTGDFKRPTLNVVVSTTNISLNGSTSNIKVGRKQAALKLDLPGLYNAYNAAAAVTVATAQGRELDEVIKRIESMPAAFGRAEVVNVDGRKLQLLLVKNPTGFNQVIQSYLLGKASQPMLILVNDLIADGRDVSWLWDVAFEDLSPGQAITSSGTRVYDLALRLKYADLDSKLEPETAAAITDFLDSIPAGQTGLVLPTYTAMLQVRHELSKLTEVTEMSL